MNNLAFQIYGTKKATPFQSVWKTDAVSQVSSAEFANITAPIPLPTGWLLNGTSLVNGGYNHTAGNTGALAFSTSSLNATAGSSYQLKYTITGPGSVVINLGNVSSAPLIAGTNVIIILTPTTSGALSITPSNDFAGNISLSVKGSASAANQINLPITSIPVGKSIWIDWGDNSYTNVNSTNIIANRIHTYSAPGEYAVRILGDNFVFGFGANVINDRLKIKSISSWGKLRMGASSFNGCSNVTMSGITDIPNLTGVTDLSNTFNACSLLTTVGRINEWNASSVTSMAGMFAYCRLFNSNIGNWNTSAVTNMSNMFGSFGGSSNFNQDISGWDVSKVTQMNQMFDYATSFNQNLSNWERPGSSLSKVTNMEYMFRGASNFNNGSASGVANQLPWTINTIAPSVVMNNMFQGASKFNSNLGTGTTPWDVSKVTAFTDMFNGASSFNNGDEVTQSKINDWDIGGSVTSVNISSMFRNASIFNRNIGNWNVSKVTATTNMFNTATAFNQPLSNWERSGSTTGNITNMQSMFQSASAFNQNIGNWDVRKVTSFQQMFQSASAFNNDGSPDINNWSINTTAGANVVMNNMFVSSPFNQSLDAWNTSEVTNMSGTFSGSAFNNGLLPGVAGTLVWDTGKVTDMSSMFSVNGRFNCNIGSWDVRNVTTFNNMFREAATFNNGGNASINTWILKETGDIDMSLMFYRARAFNQPVGAWDTSRVTNMQEMFSAVSTTSIFNQDISYWNVSRVTSFAQMFNLATAFNNGSNSDNNSVTGLPGINGWPINTTSTSVSMASMFYNTSIFNRNIGSWNMTKVTNTNSMFRSSSFNQPIGSWNVSNVTDMGAMFASNIVFNQDIGNWNTSSVTTMLEMFYQATAFNQNIGSWNVSNVTNFASFMSLKTPATFSSTNLDAIYNGWIVNGVKPNISSPLATNISFGTAKYSQAGKPGRDTLLASPNNWRITDGGNETVLALDAGNPLSYPGTGTLWTDLSGNNNNGTLVNGPTFDSANGGSIVFDGSDDYVSVNDNSTINGASQTISVWFKNTGTYTTGNKSAEILGKHNASGSFSGYGIVLPNVLGDVKIGCYVKNASIGYQTNSLQIINPLNWYNATITFSSTSQLTLYLNGNFESSTSIAAISLSNQPFIIGRSNDLFWNSYNGKIGETSIYNRALSATEVLANFDATKGRYGL